VNERAVITPHLGYENPSASIDWLCRVFGFRQQLRMERDDGDVLAQLEGPSGGVIMVSGITDDFRSWMRERAPQFRDPADQGWPYLTHTISVIVQDADAHHRRAADQGAVILTTPRDQPWGLRSYAALDPEGHQWEFSQPVREVAPESWGAVRLE